MTYTVELKGIIRKYCHCKSTHSYSIRRWEKGDKDSKKYRIENKKQKHGFISKYALYGISKISNKKYIKRKMEYAPM